MRYIIGWDIDDNPTIIDWVDRAAVARKALAYWRDLDANGPREWERIVLASDD